METSVHVSWAARGKTHVDVFGQQLVGHAVLVNDVVVEGSAGENGAGQETEDAVGASVTRYTEIESDEESHPPRKAPTGLRTGMAPAGTSSMREELWKLRRATGVLGRAARRRAERDMAREAIVSLGVWCAGLLGGIEESAEREKRRRLPCLFWSRVIEMVLLAVADVESDELLTGARVGKAPPSRPSAFPSRPTLAFCFFTLHLHRPRPSCID